MKTRAPLAVFLGAASAPLAASAHHDAAASKSRIAKTHITVTRSGHLANDAHGRLLLFAEPATSANAKSDIVDVGDPAGSVAVAACDVSVLRAKRRTITDTCATAYPTSFATLSPGLYRVQAVLDRNGDYAYVGRGAGDLVSKAVTVEIPLTTPPTIVLDRALPRPTGQFDTTGLPPAAAAQIAASRPHLHDERIISPSLTRFHGSRRYVNAWVLTPPGYDPKARTTYPTVFTAGGFGATHKLDGQQLSRQWHLMETGVIPPMIWVALDYSSPNGTTEFTDSANNGPWGEALIRDVIPALEQRYRMDARPSGRFLTGHSSGGWFALWTIVRHPELFGGAWASAPDPVDFHDFLGVDLFSPGANMYHSPAGEPRPLERDHDTVITTVQEAAQLEAVLGARGGQFRSLEAVFSPRRLDGEPALLFDRRTGAVDPKVAAYWRDHYDIAHRIEADWPRLAKDLDGKVHVVVGAADSFALDGPVRRLHAIFRKFGGRADFRYVPGATHSLSMLYAKNGDRDAVWKEMARTMQAIARPDPDLSSGRVAPAQPSSDQPVFAALAKWDMPKARALVEALPEGGDRCAATGVIADRENRLEEAARSLPACLSTLERTGSPLAYAAFEALLDTYRRRGDYSKQYALLVRWLRVHTGDTEAGELADLRDEPVTAASLRDISKPQATGSRATTLRTFLNPLGTRTADLAVRGVTLPWLIDTGANYSVVSESAARRMRLAVRDAGYQVAGTSGHSVRTRIAIVDRLPLGSAILRHLVALVVPDAALRIRAPHADYQIEAVLGDPALAQLGRFRIDPDGMFAINRDAPLLRSERKFP